LAKKKPLLLIDGDILVYQAASGVEKELEFDDDMWVLFTDLRDAQNKFKDKLEEVSSKLPSHEPMLCISGDHNFRKDIDSTYKANRKKVRKPMGFLAFRQWVIDSYPNNLSKPILEADDAMGILATKPGNDEAVIWSIDKDMMQIPGHHLVDGEVVTQGQGPADYFHMMQTLMGDPADGYKGCPGMGPKKAEKALHTFYIDETLDPVGAWGAILFAYEQASLTPEDALQQARLARILRWENWDNKKQEIKLWSPPTNEV
jgi:DNA polymerase-1